METLVYELKNFGDLYFILGVCILAIFFAVKYCIDVYQACNLPWAKNATQFEKNFKIKSVKINTKFGKETYFIIKVLKKDYLIYKTWDYLHSKFRSVDEAKQFLKSNNSTNFWLDEVHAIMMVHRLRLFYQLEKSK